MKKLNKFSYFFVTVFVLMSFAQYSQATLDLNGDTPDFMPSETRFYGVMKTNDAFGDYVSPRNQEAFSKIVIVDKKLAVKGEAESLYRALLKTSFFKEQQYINCPHKFFSPGGGTFNNSFGPNCKAVPLGHKIQFDLASINPSLDGGINCVKIDPILVKQEADRLVTEQGGVRSDYLGTNSSSHCTLVAFETEEATTSSYIPGVEVSLPEVISHILKIADYSIGNDFLAITCPESTETCQVLVKSDYTLKGLIENMTFNRSRYDNIDDSQHDFRQRQQVHFLGKDLGILIQVRDLSKDVFPSLFEIPKL